ncbi:hypothetical protein CDG77_18825 [Nostoc sp. 'Peltigera membranacea cyanobiont' 213]|uniref:hypothetical protein n=1 Tax=unclassified Nostoc TaxID=2593658 RepID=UPI000B9559E5|nr:MULTISPECIES: hypothetical protein [unclassified Nostoc]AVH65929.1 hypothetical protein NPM_4395 [Nostoc sp. 'Peltigera membranacea cyanobiont' N6]OYD89427.1 hypothetical protein CDG77_18825 [Nostoc sp. 'Peltigera membranacea cyanobiont' 213]
MNANIIKTDNQADVVLSLFIQVPQGDRFELKVERSQCSFYLNEQVVEQIQQAQKTGVSLYIPPKLIIPLWYYACFGNNVVFRKKQITEKQISNFFYVTVIVNIIKYFLSKTARSKVSLQSGLTFNSYYKQPESASDAYEEKDIILQSIVLIHGDIFHKIKLDFMQNSNCSTIISAHYWLTEQILSCFRTKLNLLVWEVASLFPAGLVVYSLYPANGILSIFAWIGFTILFATTRYVLVNQLQRRTSINSKFINWLAWTLICLIPIVVVAAIHSFRDVNALLLSFSSLIAPKLAEYILNFIRPRIWKIIFTLVSVVTSIYKFFR